MTPQIEQSVLARLSPSENQRLEAMQSATRRREFVCSRALMRVALSEIFDREQSEWQFVQQTNASPLITNLPEKVQTSLSHSHGLICFAISDCPVGVDIEVSDRTRNFTALASMFMNDVERAELSQQKTQASYFYRCWCIKEAYYKALPPDQQEGLSFTRIAVAELTAAHGDWHLTEGRIEDCYLAAISQQAPLQIQSRYYLEPDQSRQSGHGWRPVQLTL